MIDLDPYLARWTQSTHRPLWTAETAVGAGAVIAAATALTADWEPPDEEWIGLEDGSTCHGMISTRVPLALLIPPTSETARALCENLAVVEIFDTTTDDVRAHPDLLRATVLPYGWDDDFNPAGFCVQDLFVESII